MNNPTDNDTSQKSHPDDRSANPVLADVEMQRRFNELRRELLDNRAASIDRWGFFVSIFLTLIGIVVAIASYLTFDRLDAIKIEANNALKTAENSIKKIEENLNKSEEMVQDVNAKTYNNWGKVTALSGKHDEAIPYFDKAILLKPDFAEAYNNRGITKAQLGRYNKAIVDFDEAISLKPDYAGAYTNRGNAKHELGRYDAALADFDEAISLKPDYAEAYTNRGNSKQALGQYEAAIADHDEATLLKPTLAEAYYNRGVVKNILGRESEAQQDVKTALELARNVNNVKIEQLAEQMLRNLATDGGS